MLTTIVFDLDGTFVNTAPDLANATNHVLKMAGRRPVSIAELNEMVGQGARKMIERGYEKTGTPISDDELSQMFDAFLDYYKAHIAEHSQPYPGMLDLVSKIRAQGWKTAICTNKRDDLAVKLLNELGLFDQFDAIVGPQSVGIAKPDPAPLFDAIKKAGGSRDKAVLIGDSKTDIETGRNAKIPVIAVSYGYTDTHVSAFSPDHVVDDAGAIWPLLEKYFL